MPNLSLTTWSLHRNLGPLRWTQWDDKRKEHVTRVEEQPEKLSLLELPAVLRDKGFTTMEICHFHFKDTSSSYLQELREAIQQAGMRFYTLLADYGDITNPDETRREADMEWLQRWIDIASAAGAERIRIIGGDADPGDAEALKLAASQLQRLIDYAADKQVRIVTENFHAMTSTADNCLALLDACGNQLGLTSDFGNFKGPTKLQELSRTIARSESIHAKAQQDEQGNLDDAEFISCMELVKEHRYEGPITIVYDGPGDMWDGIDRVRKLVTPYLG
ncbi:MULTISPECIES: sugar phosphate isomerase/epimerase family protein [Paenibacillus]|uniref:sugar phosphate isomerase/epimerase family protein n=1 Tax=Paenibacillus TaxID=44249 RepID=UPI0011A09C92|nr:MULTISPECIES: sugar phosphate isomerase/epimerase family protein [Paenibacillus]MBJ9987805.1 sugar phosphate isomerase/epimerase [Paenibacillus sp. S28]